MNTILSWYAFWLRKGPSINPKTAGGGGDQFDSPPVVFRKMYLLERG